MMTKRSRFHALLPSSTAQETVQLQLLKLYHAKHGAEHFADHMLDKLAASLINARAVSINLLRKRKNRARLPHLQHIHFYNIQPHKDASRALPSG